MKTCAAPFILLLMTCIGVGCANITAPTGGKKDTIPPKLVAAVPADSLLNTKPKRIEFNFDEYVTISDATREVQISPMLSVQPAVSGVNKRVVVKLVDSLLEDNTTYRISLGNAVKDLHEGNVFANYTYTFSTGGYFDSLQLSGTVINAATGLADTGGVTVALYSATEKDSGVVRHKPKYITKADAKGAFTFKGLPKRSFRIYALKDANGNLIYDGPAGGEMIAFSEKTVIPGDTDRTPIHLRLFLEKADTTIRKTDTATKNPGPGGRNRQSAKVPLYSVNVDTTNPQKRSFDITQRINVVFSGTVTINANKITLTYDSAGVTVTPPIAVHADSGRALHITTAWVENSVYTLRLVKGFAKDTAGKDLPPSRYTFKTKEDEDYGKISVHLPAKYGDPKYVLVALADNDSVYQQPVTDTIINLVRLRPAKYTFRIIVDKNGNGKWDTGDLFGKLQPEEVIPYPDQMNLKAGWENILDFEQKPADRKQDRNNKVIPK